MADGTIRIYSGLMGTMDDDELRFLVGHEMDHVVDHDIQKKIMQACAGSAVRKASASQRNEAGQIARGALGALARQLVNAHFSQQEEREGDDFGLAFIQNEGPGGEPAVSAMRKLAALGNGHSFLSSHLAPEARAERLRENALSSGKAAKPSPLQRFTFWFKKLRPFDRDEQAGGPSAGERLLARTAAPSRSAPPPSSSTILEKRYHLFAAEDCHGIQDGNLPPAGRSRGSGRRALPAL